MPKFTTKPPEPDEDTPGGMGEESQLNETPPEASESQEATRPDEPQDEDEGTLSAEIGASENVGGLRIEGARGDDGWHWMLFGANGKPLATNVEPLKTKFELKKAIGRVKSAMANANLLIREEN